MFISGYFVHWGRLPSPSTHGLPCDAAPADAALLAEGVRPAPTLQQCALFPGQTHNQSQQSARSGEWWAEVKQLIFHTDTEWKKGVGHSVCFSPADYKLYGWISSWQDTHSTHICLDIVGKSRRGTIILTLIRHHCTLRRLQGNPNKHWSDFIALL